MPATDSAPALDDETTAALTLFNEYVEADRERTQREKRVKKAERAKDEAAAAVKKLGDRGSSEEKAKVETAYREAADRWKRLRDGEEPQDAPTVEEPPVDETSVDETSVDETSVEAAPAEEPPAEAVAAAEEPAFAEEPSPEEIPAEAPAEPALAEEASTEQA